jgi:hypothetical protein
MPKRKKLPALAPRAREIVNLAINSVALGTHDNDAEVGAVAEQLEMTPKRLQTVLNKLEEQGWLVVKNDFVYPTVAALLWQNPEMGEAQARKLVHSLRKRDCNAIVHRHNRRPQSPWPARSASATMRTNNGWRIT